MLIIPILNSDFAFCVKSNRTCGRGCSLGVLSLLNDDLGPMQTDNEAKKLQQGMFYLL